MKTERETKISFFDRIDIETEHIKKWDVKIVRKSDNPFKSYVKKKTYTRII